MGVITDASVPRHDPGEDLAIGAVDRLHARLVAKPSELDLLEAHRFDDAGIVGGVHSIDLEAGRLRHLLQKRLPILFLVHRGFGRDHAEIDFGRRLRARAKARCA
jgi:hypothetical protein